MLPGAEREVINLQAVLSWFGINSTAAIFPAPADLKAVDTPIERAPANELRDAVLAGSKLICLHGRGGCGKTTTMMQLTELLPADSISAVFDCYGAGSYSHTNVGSAVGLVLSLVMHFSN
jgi:ABC-type cobalamin/Fe3+-siderophores transport system ATPase subunit